MQLTPNTQSLSLITVAMLGLLGGRGEGERGVSTGFALFSISISEDTLRYSCLFMEVVASISIHEMFCKNFKLGSTVELEEIHRHTDISMPGWFCYPSKER